MEIIKKYFPNLSGKQWEQYAALEGLYKEWNQKINVISRKDIEMFYEHHVLHSLAIARQFEFPDGCRVMDMGTGGGFPAVPLAIYFPQVHFFMIDSINKKLKVAKAVADAIELRNVTVQHTRAEDIKGEKFDVVVSRAVAPLKDLWYWSRSLLERKRNHQTNTVHGLICLKGGDLSKEIHESGLRPGIWEINKIFEEDFFREKYILKVSGEDTAHGALPRLASMAIKTNRQKMTI